MIDIGLALLFLKGFDLFAILTTLITGCGKAFKIVDTLSRSAPVSLSPVDLIVRTV
jgi:hypothetical protein